MMMKAVMSIFIEVDGSFYCLEVDAVKRKIHILRFILFIIVKIECCRFIHFDIVNIEVVIHYIYSIMVNL